MAQQQPPHLDWDEIRASAPYARQAFVFVQDGLEYTVKRVHGDPSQLPVGERHISGEQLCDGLRELAIKKYGLMARTVLEHWNIQRTDDFGRIVFAMVNAGIWSSTEEDKLDDFFGIYSFEEAFDPTVIVDFLTDGDTKNN